ncbi:MAG: hypothetical protein JW782_00835 [Candidatus Saganbacteria bacterium]|nr:hypothetical protein [Candidatus Saganbacteria bacterium]
MNVNFSIHGLFNIKLSQAPRPVVDFIRSDLGYFERTDLPHGDLEIEFVPKIDLPARFVYLQHDLAYDQGVLYFLFKTGTVAFPIKEFAGGSLLVRAEKGISGFEALRVIEKVLSLKLIESGYSMMHALGLKENGRVNIYVGLQGVGKTTLALQKLRQGAGFAGEEFVLVDKDANVLCYPRGMNVHRFMGEEFHRLRANPALKPKVDKELRYWRLLSVLNFVFGPVRILKTIVRNLLGGKRFIRANIGELFPGAEILDKGRIDGLFLLFKSNDGQVCFPAADWPEERAVAFLLRNNNLERGHLVADQLASFLAYGDEPAAAFAKYLKGLQTSEEAIVRGILRSVKGRYHGQ